MPYARLRKGTRRPRKLNPSASAAYGTSAPHFAWSTSSAAKHALLTSSSRTHWILDLSESECNEARRRSAPRFHALAQLLRAAGVGAAVAAGVAGARPHHAAAALCALDGVFPLVEKGRLAGRGDSDRLRGGCVIPCLGVGRCEPLLHLGREDSRLLLLVGGEELLAHPAEDVVDDRLRDADVRVVRHPRGLEAHVAELRDVDLERDAVLESERDGDHERVHEAGEGRSLLGDVHEDVAGRAVVEEADVDVALVLADLELAADLDAVVRQAAPLRVPWDDTGDGSERCRPGVDLPGERLRNLAVVAVDRDRLDAELPRLDQELRDLVDRGLLGEVDG